jgi:FlaA1/EpsC-like NDP-sugar epimerase
VYLLDLAAFAAAAVLAFELRFDGALPAQSLQALRTALCVWMASKCAFFLLGAVSRGSWRHTSPSDAFRIVAANSAGSIVGGVILLEVMAAPGIPRSVYVLDWLLSCLLTLGGRLIVRFAAGAVIRSQDRAGQTRILVYGAGAAGLALLSELKQNQALKCDVVGFIDDDTAKVGLILDGKRVLGRGEDLRALADKYVVRRVLIAVPSATGAEMVRILKLATEAHVEYRMVPSLGELVKGRELGRQIREVAVEDLLGRKPVRLDLDRIRERVQGRVVMVTGAAGSIGSEICRQIGRFHPVAVVGFDEAETPLFHLEQEMVKNFPEVAFFPEIGSITRRECLSRIIEHYQPSILYHAAAYKHVPLMERHVFAAVETNIFGTWNVACAALERGVEDFVMISTDKAVRPTSMMGATKRVAEMLIRGLQMQGATKFVAVRFGNVLGSNGSVVPTFKEQIAAGGPVTVTHPDITRYFMTIPEAAQLVLQAFSIGKGGEVFVLEMGEAVRIADLARNLILLSGLEPDRDIEIQYTGLRPGEKMFEELNLRDENMAPTAHPKIRSYVSEATFGAAEIKTFLRRLGAIADTQDVARLVLLLKEVIPDYNPGSDLLKTALSVRSDHGAWHAVQVPHAQQETAIVAHLTQPALLN